MLFAIKLLITLVSSASYVGRVEALSFSTDGCGESKGCFRFPDSCNSSETCNFLVTYNVSTPDAVEFELSGKGTWAGVGFSEDQKMPDTDMIICVNPSEQPQSGHYYAATKSKPDLLPTALDIAEIESDGGFVKCRVSREINPNVARMRDLKQTVFLLGAIGPVDGAVLKTHDQRESSSEKVNVFEATSVSGDGQNKAFLVAHGALMTVAWTGFAIVGLFTARYMRLVWEPTKIAGQKAWFQVHRAVMTLTVSMTIAGTVVIFVETKQWSSGAGAHPYIGIIVLVFALAQPIMAFFRPHPGEPRRNLFNWVHRCLGSTALILAVVNIYLGLCLPKVGVGKAGLYAVISFYVGEFIIFLFEVYLILSQRRRARSSISQNKPEGIEMGQASQPTQEPSMPMKEAMIRTAFFVFAILLGSSVSLTIILLMVLA